MVYIARCINKRMHSSSPRIRNPNYLMVYIARCTNESMLVTPYAQPQISDGVHSKMYK